MAIHFNRGKIQGCRVGISVAKGSELDMHVTDVDFMDVGTVFEERDDPDNPLIKLMVQCFDGQKVDVREFAQLLRDVGLAPQNDRHQVALASNLFARFRAMALDVSTFAANVATVASQPQIAAYIAKSFGS